MNRCLWVLTSCAVRIRAEAECKLNLESGVGTTEAAIVVMGVLLVAVTISSAVCGGGVTQVVDPY